MLIGSVACCQRWKVGVMNALPACLLDKDDNDKQQRRWRGRPWRSTPGGGLRLLVGSVACSCRCWKVGKTHALSLVLPIEVDGCHHQWWFVQLIYLIEIVSHSSKRLVLQACCRLRSAQSFAGPLQIASRVVFHRPTADCHYCIEDIVIIIQE